MAFGGQVAGVGDVVQDMALGKGPSVRTRKFIRLLSKKCRPKKSTAGLKLEVENAFFLLFAVLAAIAPAELAVPVCVCLVLEGKNGNAFPKVNEWCRAVPLQPNHTVPLFSIKHGGSPPTRTRTT